MSLLSFLSRREPAAVVTSETATAAQELAAPTLNGRRERGADAGAAVISDALSAKLLHGWLQNRHQTLMPLTLNLSFMTGEQQDCLAGISASLLLAGRPVDAAQDFAPVLRTWLSGLGGEVTALAAFDRAIETPMPLNVIFDTAQASELTIYTYVTALMASDPRYPVSVMLCDMVQARFDLPTALVRSAVRRYRR